MNIELQSRCDLLAANKKALEKGFKWDNSTMSLAVAALFASQNKAVDVERLKECAAILKDKTNAFSEFRGNVKLLMIAKMSVSDNPEQYYVDVNTTYMKLKKSKIMGSEYKILAAMTICDYVGQGDPTPYIDKVNDLYAKMKKNHKILTGEEDIPFAAILAVSGIDTDVLIEDMEKDYAYLKKKFSAGNPLQSLSHVLAVDSSTVEEKCEKVKAVYDALKASKHKFDNGTGLPILGALSMLSATTDEIVADMIAADDYLKGIRGFGDMSLGRSLRRVYAAQMVIGAREPEHNTVDNAMLGSMLAMAIAIEVCMLIVITSVVATSANN